MAETSSSVKIVVIGVASVIALAVYQKKNTGSSFLDSLFGSVGGISEDSVAGGGGGIADVTNNGDGGEITTPDPSEIDEIPQSTNIMSQDEFNTFAINKNRESAVSVGADKIVQTSFGDVFFRQGQVIGGTDLKRQQSLTPEAAFAQAQAEVSYMTLAPTSPTVSNTKKKGSTKKKSSSSSSANMSVEPNQSMANQTVSDVLKNKNDPNHAKVKAFLGK